MKRYSYLLILFPIMIALGCDIIAPPLITKMVTSITVTGAGGATTITTDGGTLQMQAEVLPATATNRAVTWSKVNGTGRATISAGGLLTAVANGTVTATATARDGSGISGSLQITLSNQTSILVESITVTGAGGATSIMTDGGTLQMEAEVLPTDATNKAVTWSKVNGTGQATISAGGLLTAVANGVVTVTATAQDGSEISDSRQIEISNQSGGGSATPVIYAATNNGLFISTNTGGSYVQRTTANGLGADEVFGVCVSGTNVYAATHNGLSISTDGGNHFSTPFIPVGDKEVLGVFVAGQEVYAACGSDGLWISDDGGTTFNGLGTAVIGGGITTVNNVCVSGNIIYAATNKGLYASPTTSDSFTRMLLPYNQRVHDVYVSGQDIFVAADFDGLYTSTDGGAHFDNPIVVGGGEQATSVCVAETNRIIYVGSDSGGLYISIDGGQNYTKETTADGLGSDTVYKICVSGIGGSSDLVYVATYNGVSLSGNAADFSFASSLEPNIVHGIFVQ
jgi:hypothetical protein